LKSGRFRGDPLNEAFDLRNVPEQVDARVILRHLFLRERSVAGGVARAAEHGDLREHFVALELAAGTRLIVAATGDQVMAGECHLVAPAELAPAFSGHIFRMRHGPILVRALIPALAG
jgi:hypothetical protein